MIFSDIHFLSFQQGYQSSHEISVYHIRELKFFYNVKKHVITILQNIQPFENNLLCYRYIFRVQKFCKLTIRPTEMVEHCKCCLTASVFLLLNPNMASKFHI